MSGWIGDDFELPKKNEIEPKTEEIGINDLKLSATGLYW
jgi:hypothetical protein